MVDARGHGHSPVTSTHTSTSKDTDQYDRLKQLHAQIQARKRKRESEAAEQCEAEQERHRVEAATASARTVSVPGLAKSAKGKGVAFKDDVQDDRADVDDTRQDIARHPDADKGILKETVAQPASSKAAKTKAKQRYLKRKLDRRKSRKRTEKNDNATVSVQASDSEADRDADETMISTANSDRPLGMPGSSPGKTAAAAQPGVDAGSASSVTEPNSNVQFSRKELAKQAKASQAAEAMALDLKRQKKLAKKAKILADAVEVTEAVPMQEPPTQPGALPSFPRPTRPALPSRHELDAMSVAHDMREAVLVSQAMTVSTSEVLASAAQRQHLQDVLTKEGIGDLFAVQATLFPMLSKEKALYVSHKRLSDVCVAAPTGSGKTLAYVLPLIEVLSSRIITRLRALVVLPTRDLVLQVRVEFEKFCRGTGLTVGIATGHHSLSHEQSALIADLQHDFQGGSSKVDILIATPGRLVDHLEHTRNFSLQHLRFLVIDEADRLLNQSFDGWLQTVQAHIDGRTDNFVVIPTRRPNHAYKLVDPVAPSRLSKFREWHETELDEPVLSSCQKLLLSATLTRDPAILSALRLYKPVYVAVTNQTSEHASVDGHGVAAQLVESDRSFALPESLKESMVVCRTADKPLLLLHLLLELKLTAVLCFTKSVEGAARLALLLQAYSETAVSLMEGEASPSLVATSAHFSSELSLQQRRLMLSDFEKGSIGILVCSDVMARGIDLPSVQCVINYDTPIDMKKYVHRVGRTARAGKEGAAWTLLETQEASFFKTMQRDAARYEQVRKVKVSMDQLDRYRSGLELALDKLRG